MTSRTGTLLCLASGAAFGAMAVFGKLAYDEGATVATLLGARFAIAAALFWLLLAVRREALLRGIRGRDLLLALGLGAIGYATQAGLFFAALARLDASLLALLLYTFPAMVAVAAIALGRERADRRRLAALALASAGLVLVLATAGTGAIDPLGVGLALGAAVAYSAYILVSDGIAGRVPAQQLATLVTTGAALTLVSGGLALGELRPGALEPAGWGWLLAIAAISTVGAITLFFAGLRRVGPTAASILSTAEPVVTVLLAFAVFGERLAPAQLLGGAFVVGAVVVLQAPRPARRRLAPDEAVPEGSVA